MKRNIVIAILAALTITLVTTGAAFAQGYGPGGNGAGAGTSINMDVTLSNYMPSAIASVLGLNVDEVNSALASGETFTTLALSAGFTADQLPALMTEVRTTAINSAVADGVVTAEQAAFLLTSQFGGNARGNGAGMSNGTSTGTGMGSGTGLCDGTCVPQNLSTLTGGSMRRAGRPR